MTEKDYENLYDKIESANDEVFKALHFINQHVEKIDGMEYLTEIQFLEREIVLSGEEHWSYGGHEEYHYSFPIEYLFDAEFRLARKNEATLAREQKILAQKAESQKYLDDIETSERNTLSILKKKYEI